MSNRAKQKQLSVDRIQKGTAIELDVEDLAYGGRGIARVAGADPEAARFVVFVSHAVPGDRVRARIVKRKKNHAEAELEEVLSPSPSRVAPPCPLFGTCGGCSWQNLPYGEQLIHKQRQAESVLEHLSDARPDRVEPIVPSPKEWRYRNKMDFTFGTDARREPILGFHRPGRFWEIIEAPACLLQPEPLDRLLGAMTRWVRAKGLPAYNPRSHEGFLRHLVLRHSVATNEVVALLLTSEGELPEPETLAAALCEACPELKGLVWGLNTGLADVARQEKELWRWGEPWLCETLGDLRFRISPLSFFQTNTPAAERLYSVIRAMLGEDARRHRLLDAYCGTGSIGIFCAGAVREVVGIELLRDAVWDARDNAERNGVANCTFLAGEMREVLPLASDMPGGRFGRVVMDPPRGGMDKRALRGLLEIQAPVLIYVSCNPSTLARDLIVIREAGYRAAAMQAVDLFPQTYHIETVVRFEKERDGFAR
ncbi:MAG TPA: 23S rRNA (uracil(1939)-C(5))-methyltransferase RlmD [Sumerlaeia bacterium]|nr:23S rRNA (uracil(1939)-C(5))-methyltransferase RlmD [Sumerlaeia bacterium]